MACNKKNGEKINQRQNHSSSNISRCEVRVFGNGRSRAIAWVSVVSRVCASPLFLTPSLTVLLTGPDLFLGVEVILFCTCTRVQVRNTAALCGFTFLLADSRKEPPSRTQVGVWCGQCPLTSLCTHVVTCILISSSICEFACFTQADTHFCFAMKLVLVLSF